MKTRLEQLVVKGSWAVGLGIVFVALLGCDAQLRTTNDPNLPPARSESHYDLILYRDEGTGCEYVSSGSDYSVYPRMELVGDDYRQRGCRDLKGKIE